MEDTVSDIVLDLLIVIGLACFTAWLIMVALENLEVTFIQCLAGVVGFRMIIRTWVIGEKEW